MIMATRMNEAHPRVIMATRMRLTTPQTGTPPKVTHPQPVELLVKYKQKV
jgi:hypothetical protein